MKESENYHFIHVPPPNSGDIENSLVLRTKLKTLTTKKKVSSYRTCGEEFPSITALHKHIKITNHVKTIVKSVTIDLIDLNQVNTVIDNISLYIEVLISIYSSEDGIPI